MLKNNYEELLAKFLDISNKNWIKSSTSNHGGVGLTFEKELNKQPDSLYFPDYNGIELKCTTTFSKYPLYLFTVAFDGPTFPEINRLIELYGYPDKDFKDKKVLFTKINFNNSHIVNNKYGFKFSLDKDKIYLEIYDINKVLIEKKSYIYLDSIFNHVMLKLNNLALIYANKKKINNDDYFKYYKISIYELINFDTFIELLKNDDINIDLIARLNKSGKDTGRYRNKNLVFSINKDKIDKLFNKVFEYVNFNIKD